jgi:hypothetical protein
MEALPAQVVWAAAAMDLQTLHLAMGLLIQAAAAAALNETDLQPAATVALA